MFKVFMCSKSSNPVSQAYGVRFWGSLFGLRGFFLRQQRVRAVFVGAWAHIPGFEQWPFPEVVMLAKNDAVEFGAIEGEFMEVDVFFTGCFCITGVTRVLRAFVRVDELGDIPGLLFAEFARLPQRHVPVDVSGSGKDARDARAPVIGAVAP